MTKVIKRDGRKAEFDKSKIRNAVLKAFEEVDGEISPEAKSKACEVANYINSLYVEDITVEEIQDIVEEKLMASKRKPANKKSSVF